MVTGISASGPLWLRCETEVFFGTGGGLEGPWGDLEWLE